MELLAREKWSKIDGLGALIITPTRELAYQIYEVIRKVGKYHEFSLALVVGGKDLKFEWNRLHAMNILIATPGRLLHHMDNNANLSADNLKLLILDEVFCFCFFYNFINFTNGLNSFFKLYRLIVF